MDYKKEFIKKFLECCNGNSTNKYKVWCDWLNMAAISIQNVFPNLNKEKNEKRFAECTETISVEDGAELLAILVNALEACPEQDFLGSISVEFGFCDGKLGQILTPYHISELMADMSLEREEGRDWFSINDPCVGTGCMLIAAANVLKKRDINYHRECLFVGYDVDRIMVLASYVQLSLLGCPGYVVCCNSIQDCVCGTVLNPITEREVWYTPLYYSEVWQYRVLFDNLKRLTGGAKSGQG